jgi:ketosteroid isomerase-like protein
MRQFAICLGLMLVAGTLLGQESEQPSAADENAAPETQANENANESIHAELRELRDRMFAAYQQRDMDLLLKDVATDVVITWQNADRNEGHAEFLGFYNKMMNGDSKIVKDISSTLEVDGLSVLYGDDTAVARGTLADHFVLANGSDFTLDSKWTATVVKQGDSWKVASFHVSASIFDNPILAVANGWLMKTGLIAGIVGLVIGLLIGRAGKRSAAQA